MAQRTDLVPQTRTGAGVLQERSARELREDIAATRESISETVDRLGERLQQSLDWREYVAEHPYVALGASAGLGLLLSGLLKRRLSPRERMIEALSETVEDFSDRVRGNLDHVLHQRRSAARRISGAALALVANYYGPSLKAAIGDWAAQLQTQRANGANVHKEDRDGWSGADAVITRSSTAGSERN
jgi:ElaB/YqjD/DUF883 family membrane-anchored ribosome-binding protein